MLQRTPKPFDKIVKQAKRYVTDTIILRIRACYQNKMSRKQFLIAAEAAFAKPLDTELESQVLQAYKKTVPESLQFESNNEADTKRRKQPRKKRNRNKIEIRAVSSEEDDGIDHVDSTASSSTGSSSSPMFVPIDSTPAELAPITIGLAEEDDGIDHVDSTASSSTGPSSSAMVVLIDHAPAELAFTFIGPAGLFAELDVKVPIMSRF